MVKMIAVNFIIRKVCFPTRGFKQLMVFAHSSTKITVLQVITKMHTLVIERLINNNYSLDFIIGLFYAGASTKRTGFFMAMRRDYGTWVLQIVQINQSSSDE